MIRTQIQLSEEQSRKLKRLAAARDTSIAELIRGSVDALLAAAPEDNAATLRARALGVAGRFNGMADLAAGHDRYAAEAFEG